MPKKKRSSLSGVLVRSARHALTSEAALNELVEQLTQAEFKPLARGILKLARYQRRHLPAQNPNPPAHPHQPQGPAIVAAEERCDLLLFVPRGLDSRLADDATGGYGYSHVCADVGEIDVPTGKPLMVEAMPFSRVHRSFQDRYGERPFLRIPLAPVGVDCRAFRDCILSKLGEPYDVGEVLTWGRVDDPARQVCSDLVTVCLPAALQRDLARQRQNGKLRRLAVSVHHWGLPNLDVYVSPNGFGEYFHTPKGEDIRGPNELFQPEPRPLPDPGAPVLPVRVPRQGLAFGLAGLAALAVGGGLLLRRRR